jgi:hypothetical protein
VPLLLYAVMGDAGAFVALFRFHDPFLSNEGYLFVSERGRWQLCKLIHQEAPAFLTAFPSPILE